MFQWEQRTSRKGEGGGASQKRTKLHPRGQQSGRHEAGGERSVPSLALSGFPIPLEMDSICILMSWVNIPVRAGPLSGLFVEYSGRRRGYLGCRPAPYWRKAEHSFVSNIMKMMFFDHLSAGTAAQVFVSQQEPRRCLKTHDVSYIFASAMDLCGRRLSYFCRIYQPQFVFT